jgi:chromosome segregation ATPase
MQTLSERASELRSNLSAARKTASSAHIKRMNEARFELDALQTQIRQTKSQLESDTTVALRAEEQSLRSQLSSVGTEIRELTDVVEALQESSSRLKAKAQSQKAEFETKSKLVRDRSRQAEARANRLSGEIDATNREIRDLESELEELEHRETAYLELYDSLKQPLPVIQRIFAHREVT